MKLIPLDALVAEIERRKQVALGWMETAPNDAVEAESELCDDILSFLNTLEVKDVDLKDEASICNELVKYLGSYSSRDFAVAKHFFELGLKAQKGEKVC